MFSVRARNLGIYGDRYLLACIGINNNVAVGGFSDSGRKKFDSDSQRSFIFGVKLGIFFPIGLFENH